MWINQIKQQDICLIKTVLMINKEKKINYNPKWINSITKTNNNKEINYDYINNKNTIILTELMI